MWRRVVQAEPEGAGAGGIQSHVDMPASTLKRLVDAGLLTRRNEGTYHFYAADYDLLRGLTDYPCEDCCANGKSGKSSKAGESAPGWRLPGRSTHRERRASRSKSKIDRPDYP